MQRLSTGSKINSASDDAAGLAIAQRMTAQVNGLNMAVKNANDGIALTQSIEGALVEVSDMLQRLRELSVQSANDTNTGTDRRAIQEEVDLLIAEITRVSANTRFNDQLVLNGTFTDRQLQIGSLGGEAIGVSVDSVNANALGAYKVTGDIIQAQLGAGAGILANRTEAADDFVLNGRGASKTIDVALKDSAKNVAGKVNALSGETGVSATAKTYGLLSSESDVDVTVSLKINGKSTGEFVISKGNVDDAVAKVNLVSGSTGVTASATAENKVRFFSADGSDVLIENTSSDTSLRVQTLGHDGETTVPQRYWNRAAEVFSSDQTAGPVYAVHTLDSTKTTAMIASITGASAAQTFQLSFAGTTLDFTLEGAGSDSNTVGQISSDKDGSNTSADIDSIIEDIQRHASYASGNFTVAKDAAGTALVFTAKTYGEYDALAQYSYNGATAIQAASTTVGVTGPGSAQTPFGAANGSYTLVRRSDGQTYSFSLAASVDGKPTAANIETALNAIEGVSGFVVKAKDDSVDTTMAITATTDFGDFDIYSGGDIELESARQTFSGIGGVLEWDSARLTANPGDYQLSNKTTGEKFAFSIADSDSSSDIDAVELESALNSIVGVSGFTVHTKPGSATTTETDTFDFGHSSTSDTTGLSHATAGTLSKSEIATTNLTGTNNQAMSVTFGGVTADLGTFKTSSGTAGAGAANELNLTGFSTANLVAAIQANTSYDSFNFTVAANGAGNGVIFTAKTSGATSPSSSVTIAGTNATTGVTDTTGTVGDVISVNAGGQNITLNVVAAHSAITTASQRIGLDVGKDATAAQLAAALEAAKGSATGAFTADSNNDVLFTHSTAGNKTDSTGASFSVSSTAVTLTNVDGTKDADALIIYGNADFGDFDIVSSGGTDLADASGFTTTLQAGDINLLDVHLTAGNTTTDSATVQGSIELSSSDLFTVTQRDEETTTNALTGVSDQAPVNSRDATGSLGNDNYFTTRAAELSSVAAIDLRSQDAASSAIAILDGAIEKVSSMRSSLGAIENRLDHTVSNLMNISEQTESARSRIQDADFAAESAKLSKAQVLKQAGVGMLAQANASSQLVLQLLQ